jgi:AbrB family looped-hinge helix DNA binding protein
VGERGDGEGDGERVGGGRFRRLSLPASRVVLSPVAQRLTFVLPERRMRTRLSSKGQLVLPKEVRAKQGWSEGTEIEVE